VLFTGDAEDALLYDAKTGIAWSFHHGSDIEAG
jgi:hypothetical protein